MSTSMMIHDVETIEIRPTVSQSGDGKTSGCWLDIIINSGHGRALGTAINILLPPKEAAPFYFAKKAKIVPILVCKCGWEGEERDLKKKSFRKEVQYQCPKCGFELLPALDIS